MLDGDKVYYPSDGSNESLRDAGHVAFTTGVAVLGAALIETTRAILTNQDIDPGRLTIGMVGGGIVGPKQTFVSPAATFVLSTG